MSDSGSNLEVDHLFIGLLFSLEASGMQALGKVMNPMTNKVERNLDQARATIDMLTMLEKKTAGNLTADEDKMLKRVLYQLRMNYLDEAESREKSGEDANNQAEQPADQEEKSSEPENSGKKEE